MCYRAEFGCSALKDYSINTGEPRKLGSVGLRSLGMGGVANPRYTQRTPRHVLPRQIW